MERSLPSLRGSDVDRYEWPVLVCLLGGFRVLKNGRPIAVRSGGKVEGLLYTLALRADHPLPRDLLLEELWPDASGELAGQSLNTLVYSLHRLLGDALGGAGPVLYVDGYYRLNEEAGVGVDIAGFNALARAGEREARLGNPGAAAVFRARAVEMYRGDLHTFADVRGVVEREGLRARYLTLLARLADYHFAERDYTTCLDYVLRLLAGDPCREDAHRLVMRCYMRRGERAQALRQYRLCERILRAEFDAAPEAGTTALYDQMRLDPASV